MRYGRTAQALEGIDLFRYPHRPQLGGVPRTYSTREQQPGEHWSQFQNDGLDHEAAHDVDGEVSAELIPRTMSHTIDGFAAWVRTTKMPYTQCVPEALREEFIGSVVAEYVERFPPDPQGRVAVTMNRLDVIAARPSE